MSIMSFFVQCESEYQTITEGCMGEQASLEFDWTLSDAWLHKLGDLVVTSNENHQIQ